ncbi:hypothetical protein FOA52_007038 [Chlamydomonas sp. UWO 241]|nr:hypothetical protein FOA52_007038 [Chlamydomonas sp. UWO 241]
MPRLRLGTPLRTTTPRSYRGDTDPETSGSDKGRQGFVEGGGSTPPDFWALKPWWCQPWSILLTGSSIVAGSWAVLHIWWITAPVSLGVAAWWALFLVLVPSAYAQGELPQEIDANDL